jgi:hypothetical protein
VISVVNYAKLTTLLLAALTVASFLGKIKTKYGFHDGF